MCGSAYQVRIRAGLSFKRQVSSYLCMRLYCELQEYEECAMVIAKAMRSLGTPPFAIVKENFDKYCEWARGLDWVAHVPADMVAVAKTPCWAVASRLQTKLKVFAAGWEHTQTSLMCSGFACSQSRVFFF